MKIDKVLDNKLDKSFEITIPVDLINSKIVELANKKQKNYRLDGFRVGKVPVNEIIKRENTPLFYESSDDIINSLVSDLIKENGYKLASQAEVDFVNIKPNEDVSLKVSFELSPVIDDLDFKKIKLDIYKIKISDKDIDDAFSKVVDSHRKLEKKCGPAEIGDTTKIDFEGFINGEPFSGGKGEGFNLKLGTKTFIDNFEEQLIGKEDGDEVDVKVRFPDAYQSSQLAGKDALFKVKILEVLRPSDIEINDEFVKSNFNLESIEKMKEVIKKELETTYNNALISKYRASIIDKLDESFNFDLPSKALSRKIENLKKYRKDCKEEDLEKEAKKILKCGFILTNIGEKNNIDVSSSELTESIMREASYYKGREKDIINMYNNNENMLDSLRSQILEDKIIDFILNNIDRNEKELTIEEFEKL